MATQINQGAASAAPTRRSFLCATTAIAIAGSVAVPAATFSLADPIGQRLAKAITLHARALAICDAYDHDVETPARNAVIAEIEALPRETPPPHEEVATTFINQEGTEVRLTTAKPYSRGFAQKFDNDPDWADMGDEDWRQAHRELAAACGRRDAIIALQQVRHEERCSTIRKRHNLEAIGSRSDQLVSRSVAIGDAIITMPVRTIDQLADKVGWLERTSGGEFSEWEMSAIAADVRRIAGRAAA